jgi:hypothetical protein
LVGLDAVVMAGVAVILIGDQNPVFFDNDIGRIVNRNAVCLLGKVIGGGDSIATGNAIVAIVKMNGLLVGVTDSGVFYKRAFALNPKSTLGGILAG